MTQNLLNLLTIRRLELSEYLTAQSYTDAVAVAEHNRAVGMLEVIDDMLAFRFLDESALLKEEDE